MEQDLAAGRLDDAGHALDERRLTRAVRAEQTVHLALEDVEVDAVQRLDSGELLDKVADLEDLRHCDHQPAEVVVGDAQAGLDQLGRAAPDRVLVLHGQHTVEAALVERVDVAAEVDLAETRNAISPPSHVPRALLARRGPPEEPVAAPLLSKISASFAWACATWSTYGRSASIGSIPSQRRWDGSKLR